MRLGEPRYPMPTPGDSIRYYAAYLTANGRNEVIIRIRVENRQLKRKPAQDRVWSCAGKRGR